MRKNLLFFLFTLLSVVYPGMESKAQASGDAGAASLHLIRNNGGFIIKDEEEALKTNHLVFRFTYGEGERNIHIVNPSLEYLRVLNERLTIAGRVNYVATDGELGSQRDPGDIFLNGEYKIHTEKYSSTSVILGFKIPLDKANGTFEGSPLPMAYQTSMGSYDLLLGLSYKYMRFGGTIAYQQPLFYNNANDFFSTGSPDPRTLFYPSSNNFRRKGDVLMNLSYNIPLIITKLYLKPGFLPIYHLQNDKFTNASGSEVFIPDSKGININGSLNLNWFLSKRSHIELGINLPLNDKNNMPDGLRRDYVAAIEYLIRFN